jgi:hypothetical protein
MAMPAAMSRNSNEIAPLTLSRGVATGGRKFFLEKIIVQASLDTTINRFNSSLGVMLTMRHRDRSIPVVPASREAFPVS